MDPMTQWYVTLVIAGTLLISAEIFVPGAVLGAVGGMCLLVAMVMGFGVFDAPWGMISAMGIIVLTGVFIILAIKLVPHSRMGRLLTLSDSTATYKATDSFDELMNAEGMAKSDLRPSGIALFGGKRVDVVAEGNWISSGARIQIIDVEGNIVTVRELKDA